jgi:hypothetical protein
MPYIFEIYLPLYGVSSWKLQQSKNEMSELVPIRLQQTHAYYM